jgi:hypothetical protein
MSFTPVILAVYMVSFDRVPDSVNVAVLPEPLTVPDIELPFVVSVNVASVMVDGSIFLLKVAEIRVLTGTYAAPLPGDVELTVRADSPEVYPEESPPPPPPQPAKKTTRQPLRINGIILENRDMPIDIPPLKKQISGVSTGTPVPL